jgi:conjugal transfer pilus assembly protein TraB
MTLSDLVAKAFKPRGNTPASAIPGLKSGKLRQYAIVGLLFATLYGGLYLLFVSSSGDKPTKQEAVAQKAMEATHITAAGEAVDPRDRWIGTAGNKMTEQEGRLSQQEQSTKDLMAKFDRLQDELRHRADTSSVPSPASGTVYASPVTKILMPTGLPAVTAPPPSPVPYPPGTPGMAAQGMVLPPPVIGAAVPIAVDPGVDIGHVRLISTKPAPPAVGTSSISPSTTPSTGAAGAIKRDDRTSGQSFLPIGFVRSKLLGGIYASTGGQAQSNPLPVFMRIKDLAVLPNHFRANVQDCMVVGAAYGDLAAERVYIRTELLSCIRRDGQVLEVKAAGVVYDDDGKLGLRGRMISKQDKILTQALLAGVIGGIGQGLQTFSSSTTVTPAGGTITTPNPGQEMKAGIGAGVGRALDRLANYQISLAEKVFPVIEVDSDRSVDVAFTKGIELPVPLPYLTGADDDD